MIFCFVAKSVIAITKRRTGTMAAILSSYKSKLQPYTAAVKSIGTRTDRHVLLRVPDGLNESSGSPCAVPFLGRILNATRGFSRNRFCRNRLNLAFLTKRIENHVPRHVYNNKKKQAPEDDGRQFITFLPLCSAE